MLSYRIISRRKDIVWRLIRNFKTWIFRVGIRYIFYIDGDLLKEQDTSLTCTISADTWLSSRLELEKPRNMALRVALTEEN